MDRLNEMMSRYPLISDVRGKGLLIGVELSDTCGPAHQVSEWVMYESMSQGLSFKVSSGNVLTLAPALIITQSQLDSALDILENCFARLTKGDVDF